MRRTTLVLAALSFCCGLASPAAAAVAITIGSTYALVVDYFDAAPPSRPGIDSQDDDLSNSVTGDTVTATLTGFSSATTSVLDSTALSAAFAQSRPSGYFDYARGRVIVDFTVDADVSYTLGGSFTNSSGYTFFQSYLQDLTNSQLLFENRHENQASVPFTAAFGNTSGNTGSNSFSGSLTGTLLAGHNYLWYADAYTQAYPAADSGATATGSAALTFGPAPEPGVVPEPASLLVWSLLGLATAGVAWRRRRPTALAIPVVMFALYASQASAAITITPSSVGGVVIPFDTPGSAAAQTAPYGISLFVSNSYVDTQGIGSGFTGNANAPIGPPRVLSLGATPGPAAYFHFSPLPGFEINSIGISATGAFINRSTIFRVFAADEDLNFVQFDAAMIPTGSGTAGLNGGAVFLGVESTAPITAFRVWQLDGGFGILDNLVVDVTAVPQTSAVPEPASVFVWSLLALGAAVVVRRRRGSSSDQVV